MLRYRIDVSKTNEGGVASLPVEHRDGDWYAAADVIKHVTNIQVALNNARLAGGVQIAIEAIEGWLDAFGVTLNAPPKRWPLQIPTFQSVDTLTLVVQEPPPNAFVPSFEPPIIGIVKQTTLPYESKECAHGHRRRQIGCGSCVMVFSNG